MNIRIMGSRDLTSRFSSFLSSQGLHDGRIYPNRGGGGERAYVDIDDREFESILIQLESFDVKIGRSK